jgi:hypothetical protein
MMCLDKGQSKYPSMKDIVINTKGVFKLLKDLNPHKATGPDCIPSVILKSAADELLLIGQDVVLVKVTHNVAVDDVFKYFTDNRCQGYGSVI